MVTGRRGEPLSRERIVEAAIGLLDSEGEGGLTFRALAKRLVTGPGAIYWHVKDKDELVGAATDAVVAATMAVDVVGATPREVVRALALGVFDAIEVHPWIGSQLARDPWRSPILRVFEQIGRQVQALGVAEAELFTAASALLNHILGVGGQNVADRRGVRPDASRDEVLDAVAEAWASLDAEEYAFTRIVAGQLRDHDDREEFLAGIDLILAGITAGVP
ncbi:TetR family transcriptional regulator [Umezawaea sp. Da 62-37]|uniref:TetR/AcrR family transcriptional regulator n=1 Tax=Umezawaea sp. Da 62-37 TaxID=3075927 RepID=UPI0028F711B9|nr:TetR family transcriptional regulator [Umezawaea sp. Da 62-37]WNV86357.1 TetR family transcriptional regulator [Umezawaea sp. Da 62-37]